MRRGIFFITSLDGLDIQAKNRCCSNGLYFIILSLVQQKKTKPRKSNINFHVKMSGLKTLRCKHFFSNFVLVCIVILKWLYIADLGYAESLNFEFLTERAYCLFLFIHFECFFLLDFSLQFKSSFFFFAFRKFYLERVSTTQISPCNLNKTSRYYCMS